MTRPHRLAVSLLMLALSVTPRESLRAQQPPPATGNGFISGQVVEGGTTKPVPGAVVNVSSAGPGVLRIANPGVIADAQGRFVFSGLPAGEFRLRASKPGWRPGAFGLDGPVQGLGDGGEILTLAAGQRARATVPLWRDAVISGIVTDEAGEPITGATISAMQWIMMGARRRLGTVASEGTDDRGAFVLSVTPGEYVIAATSPQVRTRTASAGARTTSRYVFRSMFYPQSPTFSGGAVVTVKAGDDRNGLVIRLPLQPAFRVRGVFNAVGVGRVPARIQLRADDEMRRQYATAVDPQGRFVFENIPPGRYVVENLPTQFPASDPAVPADLWARAIVDVTDKDIEVSVDLHRKFLVSGRVEFAGGSQLPSDSGLTATVNLIAEEQLPSDVGVPGIPVGPDGRFTIATFPGRLVLSAGSAPRDPRALLRSPETLRAARNWSLRSAMHGGRDVADSPLVVTSDLSDLVVTFTDQPATLNGTVTSRQGNLESTYVLIFPTDERLWVDYGLGRRVRILRTQRDGTFGTPLPEGDYFAVAVRTPAFDRDLRNPIFLASLTSQAKRVSLREGMMSTQNLELVSVPAPNAAVAPLPIAFDITERAVVRDLPSAATSGGTISGVVVTSGSKQPIVSARVGVTPDNPFGTAGGAYTDERGQFELTDVPAGQHTLYVSKPSFASTVYGAPRPGEPGTPVSISAGQTIRGLGIEMVKGAAIGGTALDQNGQPLTGVQVSVRAYRWTARGRELAPVRVPTSLSPRTDRLGRYRIYGLPPGDYIVEASVQAGATTAMPLTTAADIDAATKPPTGASAIPTRVEVMYTSMFYPNTADSAAGQTVRLRPGDDQIIDFQFTLVPTATVSGVVQGSNLGPAARLNVSLTPNDSLTPGVGRSRFGSVDSAGAFTIGGVPPGRYLLTTSQLIAGSAPVAGALDLFVDRDVTGVVLDVAPMGTVTGTVRGDGLPAMRQPQVRISLTPLPGTLVPPNQARSATIGPDNRFSIPNVPPGRYRFELTGPNNVAKPRLASQRVRDVETVDAGLEVTSGVTLDVDVELIAAEAKVGGQLKNRAGQAVTNPYVVLFAKDSGSWTPPSRRVFGVRPDQNGRYLFPDVPAGDYLITALGDVDAGDWFDPSVLAKIAPTASPLTVRRGDALEINLETR